MDLSAYRGFDAEQPIELNKVPQVLIPVGVRLDANETERAVDLHQQAVVERTADQAFKEQVARQMSEARLPTRRTNLIIFNPEDGTSRLLLDDRGLITRLVFDEPAKPARPMPAVDERWLQQLPPAALVELVSQHQAPPPSSWPAGVVLVGLVTDDSDGDGLLTGSDASECHAFTSYGNELRRMTPIGEDWVGWRRTSEPRIIVLETQAKPMRSAGVEPRHESRWYSLDLDRLDATPMLPEELVEDVLRAAGVGLD